MEWRAGASACQTREMKGRARKLWIGAGAVAGVLVIGVGAVLFAFRDRATPVERDEVGVTVITGGGQPGDPGLYVYTTTGFESTNALGGSRHDYPAQTFVTIQPGGCSSIVRWQALEQRWEEWDYCSDGSLAGWDVFNEWFGVSNLEEWACPQPPKTTGAPGETWVAQCSVAGSSQVSGSTEESTTYEVVGYETLTVGGEQVETLHVRISSSSIGETVGSGTTDVWTVPGTQLFVRKVASSTSITNTRIGKVEYSEELQLDLISLYPGA
jgi:hypothetical protein